MISFVFVVIKFQLCLIKGSGKDNEDEYGDYDDYDYGNRVRIDMKDPIIISKSETITVDEGGEIRLPCRIENLNGKGYY